MEFKWEGVADNEYATKSEPAREEVTVTFLYDEDSDDTNVKVTLPSRVGQPVLHHHDHSAELHIPVDAVKAFVVELVRRDIIAELYSLHRQELDSELQVYLMRRLIQQAR